ncbi:MAG TPA: hypothetical protein VK477_06245, partial [Acidobacteriota bacterium]|nr:hypothetical protein [Acidobacteriota bacterium]
MRLALKALLLLAILLVVGAITLPWWLGAALRPVARAQGFTFERYETVGYGRFRLIEARFERPGVAFSAARVILDTPLFWLLRRSDAHAEISDWSLRLTPVEKSRPGTDAPGAASPATVHAQVQRVTRELRNWLPRLTAESGAISRRDQTWRIAHLTWAEGTLRASATLPTGQEVRADFTEKNDVFLIAADSPSLAMRVDLSWALTA